jgi:hypothetical protein
LADDSTADIDNWSAKAMKKRKNSIGSEGMLCFSAKKRQKCKQKTWEQTEADIPDDSIRT